MCVEWMTQDIKFQYQDFLHSVPDGQQSSSHPLPLCDLDSCPSVSVGAEIYVYNLQQRRHLQITSGMRGVARWREWGVARTDPSQGSASSLDGS